MGGSYVDFILYKYFIAVCPAGGVMSHLQDFPLVCLLRFVCKNPHVAEDVLWVLDNVHPDEIFEYYPSFAMEES